MKRNLSANPNDWNDRLEEIAMALGCDMPPECPYEQGTIEEGIFNLRRDRESLAQLVDDLSMLVKRLVRHPDGDTALKAMDYLSRKNLVESLLRRDAI